jgi:diguanylate cyclase (GGDEF)-like protein
MLECRNDEERGRVVDMCRRLQPVALAASLMLLAGGVVTIPTFGSLWLVPGCVGAIVFSLVTERLNHFRRPELALAGLWLAAELFLGASIALATGPRSYLLSVLIVPAVFGSIMFPARAVLGGVAFTLAVIVAVGLGFDGHAVAGTPPVLWVPLVTAVVLSMTGSALGSVDAASRSTAIVDQLTGTFNRMALIPRVAEIAHQAAATRSPVSVIACDVDLFKAINDELGHATGDAVLKEVARRLGACVGAFEPIYRFGGEEFVLLLAGLDLERAVEVAERLRESICATAILGAEVTMSFGVAASSAGESFAFEDVFARADGALYAAKHAGRNCVSTGGPAPVHPSGALRPPERRSGGVGSQPDRRWRQVELASAGRPSDYWKTRIAQERQETGNWLVRDQVERDHMLELNRLLGRNFRRTAAVSFLAILGAAPWFGWLTLVPPVIAGVAYNLIQMRLDRLRRPEFGLVAGWLLMQVGTALGFMLSQHSPLFALPLFLLMVIGSAAVFPRRAVVLGVAATAALLVAAAYVMAAHALASTPAVVILPLVLLGIIGLTGSAVGRSAIHYRGAAVVDDLTGMLNRTALAVRAAELAHQTAVTGERVAVVLADLDNFKAINDEHGHPRGDAVLQEVAYRIRKHLRDFDSVYRLGGEEFAVLLAGCGSVDATRVAERIWDAVRSEPVDGLSVTISCGVAATGPGEQFDYQTVFTRADAALYAAKHSGRDCVRLDAAPVQSLAA